MSWDEAFARRYQEWSAHMTADVAFYIELARKADGQLVELAIGNGRVAIPVAQATGQRVIGIDSSPAIIGSGEIGVIALRRSPSSPPGHMDRSSHRANQAATSPDPLDLRRSKRGLARFGYPGYPTCVVKVLVSLDERLLRRIDRVARSLGLSRSAYFARVAGRDVTRALGGRNPAARHALGRLDRLFSASPAGDSTAAIRAERDAR